MRTIQATHTKVPCESPYDAHATHTWLPYESPCEAHATHTKSPYEQPYKTPILTPISSPWALVWGTCMGATYGGRTILHFHTVNLTLCKNSTSRRVNIYTLTVYYDHAYGSLRTQKAPLEPYYVFKDEKGLVPVPIPKVDKKRMFLIERTTLFEAGLGYISSTTTRELRWYSIRQSTPC
jgi:hypothetical protein